MELNRDRQEALPRPDDLAITLYAPLKTLGPIVAHAPKRVPCSHSCEHLFSKFRAFTRV